MKRIAVIAYRKYHFYDFINMVNISDRDKFVHVQREEDIRGKEFSGVIRLNYYEKIKDYDRLYWLTSTRVRPDVVPASIRKPFYEAIKRVIKEQYEKRWFK